MLKNKTKNQIIAKDYKICSSLLSKTRGLMFSTKKNLIFEFDKEQKIGLHMLFVFFPIWVYYLDSDKKLIHKQKLLPFISATNPKFKSKYVLELIEEADIDIGNTVDWD